jgi:putative ABC transport system ATP-binding protein
VDRLSEDQRARIRNRRIGFVFQNFNLLGRVSVLENVGMPLLYSQDDHNWQARAAQTLQRVGLGQRLHHRPNELSGGERQRAAIARALIHNPALILADEPTGNLDSHTSIEVMSVFQALNDQGITIILVTHEADIAQYARRVLEMRDGRVRRDERVHERRVAAEDLAHAEPAEIGG